LRFVSHPVILACESGFHQIGSRITSNVEMMLITIISSIIVKADRLFFMK